MPIFAYKGVDSRGKAVSGAKDADSPKGLRALLRREGIVVTDVSEARAGKTVAQGRGLSREVDLGQAFQRIKTADVATFTRQLSTLLRAGIPLAEALAALFEQIDNQRFKTVVGEVRTRVNEGTSLADALGRYPRIFPEVYVSMVRSGETAGNLDLVLERLAEFLEGQIALRSRILAAMIYPAIMAVMGTVIMAILMIAVVPQITQMFEDSEKALPWNTVILIFASDMIGGYWPVWLVLIPVGGVTFFRWMRSPRGRPTWDRFKLRLPVVGALARKIAVARFSRTLGTMLSSGVPLLRALDISKAILDNHVLMKVVEGAREQIQQGDSIASTLRKSGEFPPMVTHMIAVGERAGQLEDMLSHVAKAYEREVEMALGRLTALLEPVMIVLMGGAVAFVVASILMPIMEMNTFVK
jgi:general secretion pathway protein F